MTRKSRFSLNQIEDQTGRVAIVTGANSGIGFETARALAEKGAQVVLACRSEERGQDAVRRILQEIPQAAVEFQKLDLSDLNQVADFAAAFKERHGRLDLLINNAGVMVPPESRTAQGFELQFGVNHLGHFALTLHLLDRLQATSHARVVNVSSLAHRSGKMDFDDLNWNKKRYAPWASYGQSKLANMLFTKELQRRLDEMGSKVAVLAAHPGWTATNLQKNSGLARIFNPMMAMSPAQGALPTLYAATAKGAKPGSYYGPDGLFEVRGHPKEAFISKAARNDDDARKLWDISEELTGVKVGLHAANADREKRMAS
jgi:NAD(P)-dependent dehydrogenase (short-subunit alcohol dehydrogenase family)